MNLKGNILEVNMSNFKTIYKAAEAVDIIKKSKFIAYVKPVETVEEANAFIECIKKKHWNANHNVPVYVLGDQFQIQKFSDDGEPSGTAGLPVLEILKKEGITNVAIVITRFFGGIKLGTGGLVRAYSHTAKKALEEAIVIEMMAYQSVSVIINYTIHGKIQNFLSLNENYFLEDTVFSDHVELKMLINSDEVAQFKSKIIDLTNDNSEILLKESKKLAISDNKWIK